MGPSTAELEQALIDSTCEVFSAEPDGTSVNKVRRHVEEKLGLEEGFFASGSWKQKSKALIKEYVVRTAMDSFTNTALPLTTITRANCSTAGSPTPKSLIPRMA